ncbi:MAG: hypothetical protein LBO67_00415 [Spirochaetaceae bacterium]|jgi:hypothetical protein|nr:hypothetical protein [Spirochaetaceae bacterium]
MKQMVQKAGGLPSAGNRLCSGETDPLFARLHASCEAHQRLWNAEAESILLTHFGVTA